MKRTPLEPGLLQIFRVLVGARLALLSLSLLSKLIWPEQRVPRYPALGIVGSVLLLAYLSWPWLRDHLGRAYLPLALAWATVGPSCGLNRFEDMCITTHLSASWWKWD